MQHFENYCIYDFELEIWVQTKSLFENQFDPGPIKEKFWVQFFFFYSLITMFRKVLSSSEAFLTFVF